MFAKRSASAVIVLAGLLVGCQQPPAAEPAPVAPPTDSAMAQEMRQRFAEADPNAVSGVVSTVLADKQYAAVSDVDVSKFAPGDTVTILDGNMQTLGFGTVKAIVRTALHVKYEPASDASRGPQSGDLVVKTGTTAQPIRPVQARPLPAPVEPAAPAEPVTPVEPADPAEPAPAESAPEESAPEPAPEEPAPEPAPEEPAPEEPAPEPAPEEPAPEEPAPEPAPEEPAAEEAPAETTTPEPSEPETAEETPAETPAESELNK